MELPPSTRIESVIGKPKVLDALKPRPRTAPPPEDHYTYDRAPGSSVWYAIGDGLPTQKPWNPPSGTYATARYRVVQAYWGDAPTSSITLTGNYQTAVTTARNYAVQWGVDVWVEEWQKSSGVYNVIEQFDGAGERPRIVLTGEWPYATGPDAVIHAAEIELACAGAAQLFFQGKALTELTGTPPAELETRAGDRLYRLAYTLTVYTTQHLTAQELARRLTQ